MKNLWILAVLILYVCLGCFSPRLENPTEVFAPAQRISELKNKKLKEISGLAASRQNPGLFWVHNDSGNKPEIYLIDTSLEIHLTCRIGDVENRDWEDIAVGPGPEDGKWYVYVGEIGDNDGRYEYKHIYRFEEPLLEKGSRKYTIQSFDTITFRLEDKRKDTETLLIDPLTKTLYVISKREKPVWLYELANPHSTKDTLVARKVLSLPFTQIVGGDVRSDGNQILLKNYEHVYFWRSDTAMAVGDLLRTPHFEVPYEIEPQGEALSWTHDGTGFYTISEKNVGKSTYLYYYHDRSQDQHDAQGEAVSH
jgi:hypothetical protein